MDDQIVPLANKPGYFLILSSDGKTYYEVNRSGSCQCADYCFRRAATYDLCRHGKALRRYLDEQKACPACAGRGAFIPRLAYASGADPIPCSTCSGSGARESADPHLLAIADAYRMKEATR